MALIVIPRRVPWRRQPHTGQRPAQALDYLLNPALEITIDASGRLHHPDYLSGGDKRVVTPFGKGVEFTGSSERLRWVAADTAFQRIQNFTRSLLFYSVSGGTLPDGAYLWDVDIVRAGIAIGLDALAASTLGAVYYDGSVFRVLSSGVSSLTAGELHLVQFAKRKGVGHYLYFDGALVASDAITTDVTYQSDRGAAIGSRYDGTATIPDITVIGAHQRNYAISEAEAQADWDNFWRIYSRTQRIFIPSGALSLSSAATLRDGDKPIATQQKTVSVDALIRAADLLIGTPQKSLSVDALLVDADKLSTASRHEATLAAQLLDGDVSIAPAQKAGSISGLLQDADKATGAGSKAALITGLLLDGDLLTALGSQIETHQSAGMLSGADVLIAGVTTNRTVAGKAQDGDTLTVASAVDRLSAALGIEPESMTSASTSARSIGALIVEGEAAIAGIQSGRLQPALLIDGDILIITSSTVAQADLAGRINLSGRYAPQVSLVGVYAPAINLKGRVH